MRKLPVFQSEFDEFKKSLSDLCTAVNRPFNDDLCRVFWEDLKSIPLGQVQFRAKLLRATGKTKFTSNDLRPPPEEKPVETGPSGPSVMDQLNDFVIKNFPLTERQVGSPWQYLGEEFDAPGVDGKMRRNHGVNITGVVVPADGNAPSYRVMVQDMSLGRVA
jgi:hypothetical protein